MSTLKVNPVMYLLVQKDHGMSAGKMAAQVAHAAVQAYKISPDDRLKHIWDECGQHYTKIVLQCDDLHVTNCYLLERGFKTRMIIDEGRTEFPDDLTRTALGVQIVDKNRADVQATFSAFKLYRDPKPENFGIDFTEAKLPTSTAVKERLLRAYSSRRRS